MTDEKNGLRRQRLLLGTHTSDGEQNHLMLAEVQLPLEDSEYDARAYDEQKAEVGGVGGAKTLTGVGHVNVTQQINHDGEVRLLFHVSFCAAPLFSLPMPKRRQARLQRCSAA